MHDYLSLIERLPLEARVFLRSVAEGGLPPVQSGLPEPLPEILGGLLESLE